jgi:hypothetical protein
MSLQSLSQKKKGKGLAALAGVKPARPSDLSSIEGLSMEAERAGLGDEAAAITEETPKLGFLQRLSKGLGAFNPAEAILTGKEEGAVRGVGEYAKNIVQGIGSAVTGNDYEGERRTFADVAEEMGVENKIAKFGIGFVGDVLLDPSTYFGGAIAKGVVKGASATSKVGLKTIGKVSPEVEQGMKLVGTGLQDALGRAFQYGYKTSKGAKEDVLTFLSKEQKAKLGLASSNLDRLGTGILSPAQREELALKMIAGKRAEFAAREAATKIDERLLPLVDKDGMITVHRAAPEFPTDKFSKDTFVATDPKNARYYAESHYKGNPSDIALKSFQIPASLLKRGGSADAWQLVDDYPISSNPTKLSAAREAAQSSDPLVQKTIDEQIARSQKMADGITENPYEVYFPFIKKDKLTKFLNESTGIKVGSQGYRKQFKNLLTNENMELDPAKAFFTREAQIVTDRMSKDFLTGFVGKYGKSLDSFKSVDDAIKEGYTLIKEKGNFGKELGYVSKYDGALIRDSMSPEFQTVNMLAKATGFDAVTSLFKRSVTGLFAPFHVRNFVSGQIQNFEVLGAAALNPKNIAVGQKIAYMMGKGEKIPGGTIEIAGKPEKLSSILKPFIDRFSGDTFYNADFAMALKNGAELKQVAGLFSKSRIKETVKTVGLGQEAIPFKVGRAIGQFLEHQQKATAYVTALNQGKNIDEALKLAEAAGFDYRALTRFESQILRRVIPFYSFTRKNVELQLKTLGENPERINQVLSFFENISEAAGLSDEEREKLPDYLKDQLIVSFGKNQRGDPIVAGGFGTPIEQPGSLIGKGLDDSIRKISSSLNPIIKTPLERAFGKDFFLDRPIKEVVDAKQYQILPEFIKDFVGFREVKKKDKNGKTYTSYTADPEKLHILRNLPTTRLFNYLYEIYRPENETIPGAKALNLTTGVKPKPIDLETVEYFKNRDKQRELEELLIRAGVLKEFKKTYKPKD